MLVCVLIHPPTLLLLLIDLEEDIFGQGGATHFTSPSLTKVSLEWQRIEVHVLICLARNEQAAFCYLR